MLAQQQNEINEYIIYTKLAQMQKNEHNKEILLQIAKQEKRHYEILRSITKKDLYPQKWVVLLYIFLAKFFGLTFTLKLMEKNEQKAQHIYAKLAKKYPQLQEIIKEESMHENELLSLLDDRVLLYAGAVVLGMNDALVELTGTLTGVALAFDNAKYVGLTGVIMGVAASLSMAGSAYLEARENSSLDPVRYALYTGISYIFTTIILVVPFFVVASAKIALVWMFVGALLCIVVYNFYISVAKDEDFVRRIQEMVVITFGVALISFAIGYVVNKYFGIEV